LSSTGSASPAADCASGVANAGLCVAGERGEGCVGFTGSGTCAGGLACLAQVCR
jgi:hypothetical protein